MHTYNHWISNTEQPTTAKAFTYTIWFPLLGLRYIGYKTVSDKSKWLTYKSSSRPVNKLISNGHTAIYRIIKWFDNADDARTEEVSAMTSYDVTNRSEYLNQCISGVKFGAAGKPSHNKGKTFSDETREKMRAAHKGKTLSANHRAKISAGNKGKTISAEARAKMSLAGKTISDETRAKMRKANQIGLYITPLGTFKTLKEASITNGCAYETIRYRCKSTSPQFDNWAFFKY